MKVNIFMHLHANNNTNSKLYISELNEQAILRGKYG